MERLTYKMERKRGDRWEGGYYSKHNKQRLINALAAYEDIGMMPGQIREIDHLYAEKCREVAELRQRDTPVKVKPIGEIHKNMNDGWIPVNERLPEVDKMPETDAECPEFNVTIRGAKEATTLKYSPFDDAWFDDNGNIYPVIAWRPLPKPYRLEREVIHDEK